MIEIISLTSESESRSVVSDSLQPHGLYSPWNSAGQNTWVGSLSLLQGIFPIQGSNPGFPCCRQILYQLSHKGSPMLLRAVKMMLIRPISRWLSELTAVSKCGPSLHLYTLETPIFKSFAHWLSIGGVPCPRLPASTIKEVFLSNQSCLFIGLQVANSLTPLSIT